MNKIFLIILSCIFFIACNSQESELAKIAEFEKSEKTGTKEGLAELAKMHKNYGLKFEDDQANDYLYAAGQYYYYEGNLNEAKKILGEYLTRDDSTERFRNAAINLAIVHSKSSDFQTSDELISEVLDKDLPTPAQWQDIIKIYQDKIATNQDIKPKDYERLALAHTAVGRFANALASLDTAIVKFPKFEKRADLIYRAGFIGWEYLKDTKVATNYYNQFLKEYPNDSKVGDVKSILNSGMLTMTNEAILEMLKGKAK